MKSVRIVLVCTYTIHVYIYSGKLANNNRSTTLLLSLLLVIKYYYYYLFIRIDSHSVQWCGNFEGILKTVVVIAFPFYIIAMSITSCAYKLVRTGRVLISGWIGVHKFFERLKKKKIRKINLIVPLKLYQLYNLCPYIVPKTSDSCTRVFN